jgi:hypothetical protein
MEAPVSSLKEKSCYIFFMGTRFRTGWFTRSVFDDDKSRYTVLFGKR